MSIYLQNLIGRHKFDDPEALSRGLIAHGATTMAGRKQQAQIDRQTRLDTEAKEFQDWQKTFKESEAARAGEHQEWYRGFMGEKEENAQSYRQKLLDVQNQMQEWQKGLTLRNLYGTKEDTPGNYLRTLAGLPDFPVGTGPGGTQARQIGAGGYGQRGRGSLGMGGRTTTVGFDTRKSAGKRWPGQPQWRDDPVDYSTSPEPYEMDFGPAIAKKKLPYNPRTDPHYIDDFWT